MIHVVFEEANVAALRKSFELDATLKGDIISINDDYAVGPMAAIYTAQGIENRQQWWKEILQGGHYEGIADDGHVDDNEAVAGLKAKLSEHTSEVIWIWAAQNKHDVSGYYWLLSQLKEFEGRVFILYLNNLPFISEKGAIFYPTSLFEIPPKEFVKAKKLARPVTLSEFEVDSDEWIRIIDDNKGIRVLEGGKKLSQKGYDYYDFDLLKFITDEWQKPSKIFKQYYTKVKETTGDAYLIWRLTQLAAVGRLEIKGNLRSMKEFEVRCKGAGTGEAVESESQ